MCLLFGRAYGIPTTALALLQRLRHAPGALEPLHRRARDLRLAAAQRPAAADLRGRAAAARLRPCARRGAGLRWPRSSDPSAAGHAINVGSGVSRTVEEVGRALARAVGRPDLHPQITGRTAPATSATASPTSRAPQRLLGFRPEEDFDAGLRELADWLAGRGGHRPGRRGDCRSWRGGGWSHEQPAPLRRCEPEPVLITGGAGFLGANLADRLAGRRRAGAGSSTASSAPASSATSPG